MSSPWFSCPILRICAPYVLPFPHYHGQLRIHEKEAGGLLLFLEVPRFLLVLVFSVLVGSFLESAVLLFPSSEWSCHGCIVLFSLVFLETRGLLELMGPGSTMTGRG